MRSTWRIETHSTDLRVNSPDQQLHLNHVVISSLKNVKLDHIAERKIRISLDKLVNSFLKVKLQRL